MVSVQGFWLCFLGQSAVLVLSCLCLSLCQGRSQHCVAFAGAGPNLSTAFYSSVSTNPGFLSVTASASSGGTSPACHAFHYNQCSFLFVSMGSAPRLETSASRHAANEEKV